VTPAHLAEGDDEQEEDEGVREADDREVRAGLRLGAGRDVERHDGADDEDKEQRPDQLRDVGGEPSILHFESSSSLG
jgi:hypothetical protein